VKERDSN